MTDARLAGQQTEVLLIPSATPRRLAAQQTDVLIAPTIVARQLAGIDASVLLRLPTNPAYVPPAVTTSADFLQFF